jgi:hypothetical protein
MIKVVMMGVWAVALLLITAHAYREFIEKGGTARYLLTLTFLGYSSATILAFFEYWIAFSRGDIARIALLNILLDVAMVVTFLLLFLFFNELMGWTKKRIYLFFTFAGIAVLSAVSHTPEIILIDGTPIAIRAQYKAITMMGYVMFILLSICYRLIVDSRTIPDAIAVIRVRTITVGLLLHIIGFILMGLKSPIMMQGYVSLLDFLSVFTFVSAIIIFYVGFVAPDFILNIFKRTKTYNRYVLEYSE